MNYSDLEQEKAERIVREAISSYDKELEEYRVQKIALQEDIDNLLKQKAEFDFSRKTFGIQDLKVIECDFDGSSPNLYIVEQWNKNEDTQYVWGIECHNLFSALLEEHTKVFDIIICPNAEKLINYLTEEEIEQVVSTDCVLTIEQIDDILARLREEYSKQKNKAQKLSLKMTSRV